jgi:DNA polymerase I-like protein with 3'-5' exonuclease and polymerase domains
MFQGLAADAAKYVMFDIFKRQNTDDGNPLYGTHMVLFVHDEIIIECPAERGTEVFAEHSRVMIEGFRAVCPDVAIRVEGKIAHCYEK